MNWDKVLAVLHIWPSSYRLDHMNWDKILAVSTHSCCTSHFNLSHHKLTVHIYPRNEKSVHLLAQFILPESYELGQNFTVYSLQALTLYSTFLYQVLTV